MRIVVLLLLLCGCAAPVKRKTVTLPPMPPMPMRSVATQQTAASVASVTPPSPKETYLWWEHDGLNTDGFDIERTDEFWTGFTSGFVKIGFVPVSNPWQTNATNYTYRFTLTNEPPDQAFYRVGAREQ